MPQSLATLLVHVIFSTKNRANLIAPEIEAELFSYTGGIVKNNQSALIAANGTPNHVHLLISLGKNVALSSLIGDVKRDSSKWIKTKDDKFNSFQWQDGYGAFSIGQSQTETVKKYIERQKIKHQIVTFEEEFREFLDKYQISFDERYVWD
jgi:REP element-mobilizing transposase RayT